MSAAARENLRIMSRVYRPAYSCFDPAVDSQQRRHRPISCGFGRISGAAHITVPCRAPNRAAGFTFIGLLVAIVIIGVALAAVGEVWSVQAQREREVELLYRGHAIRRAIADYVTHNAGGARFPMQLEDLVQDPRWPVTQRYLRRIYADPMTGAADWTLIRSGDGGIMGVASSSQLHPIKRQGFAPGDAGFADADCYCTWRFVFRPRGWRSLVPGAATAPAGAPGTGAPGATQAPGTLEPSQFQPGALEPSSGPGP